MVIARDASRAYNHTLKFQLRFEQFSQTDVLKQIGGMSDVGVVFIAVNLVAFFGLRNLKIGSTFVSGAHYYQIFCRNGYDVLTMNTSAIICGIRITEERPNM